MKGLLIRRYLHRCFPFRICSSVCARGRVSFFCCVSRGKECKRVHFCVIKSEGHKPPKIRVEPLLRFLPRVWVGLKGDRTNKRKLRGPHSTVTQPKRKGEGLVKVTNLQREGLRWQSRVLSLKPEKKGARCRNQNRNLFVDSHFLFRNNAFFGF